MIALVPSWPSTQWHFETDAMVQLAKLLGDTPNAVTLWLMSPQPGLRCQLQTAGLTGLSTWNVFDDVQQVPDVGANPLYVNDLSWPDGAEFVSVENEVTVYVGANVYATVTLHPQRFVWRVRYPASNGGYIDAQFDDRGFVSTRVVVDATGQQQRKEWLSPTGAIVLTADAEGAITVMAGQQSRFGHAHYESIVDLVRERVNVHLTTLGTLPLMLFDVNDDLVHLRKGLFANRVGFLLRNVENVKQSTLLLLTSTVTPNDVITVPLRRDATMLLRRTANGNASKLKAAQVVPLAVMPTTLALGHSNELSELYVDWDVGNLPNDRARVLLLALVDLVRKDDARRLVVTTGDDEQAEWLRQRVKDWVADSLHVDLDSTSYREVAAFMTDRDQIGASPEQEEQMIHRPDWDKNRAAYYALKHVNIQVLPDYYAQIDLLQQARLLIDTGARPNLWLQVATVSAGIPQIDRGASDLVVNGANGVVTSEVGQVALAADRYLNDFQSWNEALVANVDVIERNATGQLAQQWRQLNAKGVVYCDTD